MKEVVVILSIMWAGHLAIYGGVQIADHFDRNVKNLPELVSDPKFAGFEGEQPLTRPEIERYKRIYHIPASKVLNASDPKSTPLTWSYSQPSSLISLTSNPSERRASPAIF